MSKMEKMGLNAESFDLVKFLNIVKERKKKDDSKRSSKRNARKEKR